MPPYLPGLFTMLSKILGLFTRNSWSKNFSKDHLGARKAYRNSDFCCLIIQAISIIVRVKPTV